MKLYKIAWLVLVVFLGAKIAKAEDIYIAQSAAGSANGTSCANTYPYTWFNNASNWAATAGKIGPGDTVHICGTITVGANADGLVFQGNGAAGSPITLLFEPGAVLQSPYFGNSVGMSGHGAIVMGWGRSYLTVDGGSNGIIQNTANGSQLNYRASSTGVSMFHCNTCTVTNLQILNMYVNTNGDNTLADASLVRAIDFNGSNLTISNNKLWDCGWCLMQYFVGGDNNIQIYNNDIAHFDHGWALAGDNANGTPVVSNIFFHDNRIHDTVNWDAPGCTTHHIDDLHVYQPVSTQTVNNLYYYNNYAYGNRGQCATGMLYVEGGNVVNQYYFNNVWDATNSSSPGGLSNGWIGLFGSNSTGETVVENNTVLGPNASDSTYCYSIKGMPSLVFRNNIMNKCSTPLAIAGSKLTQVDNNLYGAYSTSNGFNWSLSYVGSFANWKSSCGCDAHSIQNNTTGVNSDGSLQSTSPALKAGINLMSTATAGLAGLAKDTTEGGTRAASPRPSSGNWDIGAFATVSSNLPSAPLNLVATPQ